MNNQILAIDPGTTESAFVVWSGSKVEDKGIIPNTELLHKVRDGFFQGDLMAIEGVASFGLAVGKEVFETCYWIGRLMEACDCSGRLYRMIYRMDVKMFLCHSMRAKDANIRQALIDKLGPVGTKKNPGPCYGIHSHLWSALAIAVVASETKVEPSPNTLL